MANCKISTIVGFFFNLDHVHLYAGLSESLGFAMVWLLSNNQASERCDFYSACFLDIDAVYNTSDTKINIINNEYQMISSFKASHKINDYL